MRNILYNKIIDIADFSNPTLSPYLKEVAANDILDTSDGIDPLAPDSMSWQHAMMLRTFDDHGILRDHATFAGIGAGFNAATFLLAKRGGIVFPTDRYLEITPTSNLAPASMMLRPEQFTNLQCLPGSVIPVHSDARSLRLPSNFCDGVFAIGVLERLGSCDAIGAAAEEIGRILKPGGIATITTNFRLDGPNDRAWFDDNHILFTLDLIQEYVVDASQLELVGQISTNMSDGTFDRRAVFEDLTAAVDDPLTLADKRDGFPNLTIFHEGFVFGTMHLALRKRESDSSTRTRGPYSLRFTQVVEEDAASASGVLTGQMRHWADKFRPAHAESIPLPLRRVTREQYQDALDEGQRLQHRCQRLEFLYLSLARPIPSHSSKAPTNVDLVLPASEQSRMTLLANYLMDALSKVNGRSDHDILRDLAHTVPELSGLSFAWHSLFDRSAEHLYTAVGELKHGVLQSRGQAGYLAFGPYIPLSAGFYRVVLGMVPARRGTGQVLIDVYHDPETTIASRIIDASEIEYEISFDFSLPSPVENFQVRVVVPGEVDVGVRGLRIEQRLISVETPKYDLATGVSGSLSIENQSPSWLPKYSWELIHETKPGKINTSTGAIKGDVLISDGKEGFLAFGPYLALSPGRYRAVFDLVPATSGFSDITLDININMSEIINSRKIDPRTVTQPIELQFALVEPAVGVEARIAVMAEVNIGVRSVKIERLSVIIDED